jgi:hypothetical protein
VEGKGSGWASPYRKGEKVEEKEEGISQPFCLKTFLLYGKNKMMFQKDRCKPFLSGKEKDLCRKR